MPKHRYFHASPFHFSPGDVLHGRSCGVDPQSRVPVVFLNQSPMPHYSIWDRAVQENWFVYEVRPLSRVRFDRSWDEAFSTHVEVVRRVGHARGITQIANRHTKAWERTKWRESYVVCRSWKVLSCHKENREHKRERLRGSS